MTEINAPIAQEPEAAYRRGLGGIAVSITPSLDEPCSKAFGAHFDANSWRARQIVSLAWPPLQNTRQ
jgi:hypothetical protein